MSDIEESETAYDPTSLEGVPEAGSARLQQNRAGLFTSDLSVNEFLLIKQAGFDPVGLVVGQLDLPHRHPGGWLEEESGDDGPLGSYVRRAPAGDDAHGGGGRPARR